MSKTNRGASEQKRLERMELYDQVYQQLPPEEQLNVNNDIGDWVAQLPRFGPTMGKELLLVIGLRVAEVCQAHEARRQKGELCSR